MEYSMIADELIRRFAQEYRFSFTSGQAQAAAGLAHFLSAPRADAAFILRGYAGTGKTTLVAALVRVLRSLDRETVLLAPTGRAAKVFSRLAGVPAYTLHKVIYRQQTFQGEGTHFSLGFNRLRDALFVVDEASMISLDAGSHLFGSGQLLDDLIRYVYQGAGCRLLLVGDTAQLPPVGQAESPALSAEVIAAYGLRVYEADLTEVVRQHEDSGVLAGATRLRQLLTEGFTGLPVVVGSADGEVRFLPGDELIEALVSAYGEYGTTDTIVITRSNQRANVYNNGIRSRIFDREEQLTRGDMVMAVKNNYYWAELAARGLPDGERMPFNFIANGDAAQVVRIRNVHEQYGFHFADATLRFPDYADYELECRVLLDTLQSASPSLTADESSRLYEQVLQDYAHIPSRRERMKQLRQDPYYNALQLKYAYAVTCHKAQGGQWSRVFVDQGYLPPDAAGPAYLRWLYTAFTRTTGVLYLVNWPKAQQAFTDGGAD